MRKASFFLFIALITMTVMTTTVAAQTPVGVKAGAWAKVEAQLKAQGVRPAGAKAGRDVPSALDRGHC